MTDDILDVKYYMYDKISQAKHDARIAPKNKKAQSRTINITYKFMLQDLGIIDETQIQPKDRVRASKMKKNVLTLLNHWQKMGVFQKYEITRGREGEIFVIYI